MICKKLSTPEVFPGPQKILQGVIDKLTLGVKGTIVSCSGIAKTSIGFCKITVDDLDQFKQASIPNTF